MTNFLNYFWIFLFITYSLKQLQQQTCAGKSFPSSPYPLPEQEVESERLEMEHLKMIPLGPACYSRARNAVVLIRPRFV